LNSSKKSKNKIYNLFVIKTSKTGSNLTLSRLCERCVIAIDSFKCQGIKINKLFYSNNEGGLTKISSTALFSSDEHHVTKFYKNNNYIPSLCCCCEEDDECFEEDDDPD